MRRLLVVLSQQLAFNFRLVLLDTKLGPAFHERNIIIMELLFTMVVVGGGTSPTPPAACTLAKRGTLGQDITWSAT
jgi:hypothetical protein